jgi:serine protease inhibitor
MSSYARPRWAASAVLACAALALTSCASSTQKAAPTGGGATLVGKARAVSLGSLTPQEIGAAQTAFGLDLLAERCAAQPNANDVLSPASAAIALSMLDAGAGAGTGTALSKLLHMPAWGPDVVAALRGQHASLTALKQLQVSNRLYSQLGIKPQPKVLDDLATAFGAGLQTLDFAAHAAAATDTINNHVDTDTHGLIPKLFDTPLEANTTTVLTNALYLDAKWAAPFHTADAASFHTAAGKTVSAPLIASDANFGQLRNVGGWQSVTLPYSGGKLEAVVLLPATSTSCAAPTAAQLKALTSGTAGEAEVQMPKLKLSQTTQLADDLAKLGLPLGGDYIGFGTTGDISQIVQKTVLQVDERGTKAAAATGIAVATSLGPTLTVDRPYLLLIRDTATGTPLFFARISDPTATGE